MITESGLNDYLFDAINQGASDLHITVGIPPSIRINGLSPQKVIVVVDEVVFPTVSRDDIVQEVRLFWLNGSLY